MRKAYDQLDLPIFSIEKYQEMAAIWFELGDQMLSCEFSKAARQYVGLQPKDYDWESVGTEDKDAKAWRVIARYVGGDDKLPNGTILYGRRASLKSSRASTGLHWSTKMILPKNASLMTYKEAKERLDANNAYLRKEEYAWIADLELEYVGPKTPLHTFNDTGEYVVRMTPTEISSDLAPTDWDGGFAYGRLSYLNRVRPPLWDCSRTRWPITFGFFSGDGTLPYSFDDKTLRMSRDEADSIASFLNQMNDTRYFKDAHVVHVDALVKPFVVEDVPLRNCVISTFLDNGAELFLSQDVHDSLLWDMHLDNARRMTREEAAAFVSRITSPYLPEQKYFILAVR